MFPLGFVVAVLEADDYPFPEVLAWADADAEAEMTFPLFYA